MIKSKIRDENYFQVTGWMLNRLHLKGVMLEIFAIIYGFSQDGESEFTGSIQYLSDFTGTSRPTVIKALKGLTDLEYIIKTEQVINGVQFNKYKVNLQVVKKLYHQSKETLQGGSENSLQGGSKETLPNNKSFNNKGFNKNNIIDEFETLWKLYPRKLGKDKALQAYTKARTGNTTFEQVEQGIKAYCEHIKKEKIATAFIKHGSTWFNGGCWKDEYEGDTEQQEPIRYGGTYL